jgi:hypothetical protein
MPDRKPSRRKTTKQSQPSLSLKIESTDAKNPYVDADDFLSTAEKWLKSLKAFAAEQGQQVKWEIVGLRQASALIEVQAVKVKTGKPSAVLAKRWDEGIRKMERTGRPAAGFRPQSLVALRDFVSSLPKNAVVKVGNGQFGERLQLTALTQRRVEEASSFMPVPPKREYSTRGSIRGRLAMTPRVRTVLENRWDRIGKPLEGWIWLAPTLSGHVEPSSLKKQHRKALGLAGVRRFVLYSLRHTFLTRLGESGCDAWTLARIAGHSSIAISSRYVHPSEDAVLLAMSRLGRHKIGHSIDSEQSEDLAKFSLSA